MLSKITCVQSRGARAEPSANGYHSQQPQTSFLGHRHMGACGPVQNQTATMFAIAPKGWRGPAIPAASASRSEPYMPPTSGGQGSSER